MKHQIMFKYLSCFLPATSNSIDALFLGEVKLYTSLVQGEDRGV